MTNIATVLRAAERTLQGRSDSPRLDAELLLGRVLRLSRSALIVRAEDPIAAGSGLVYERLICERALGTPVAYLTGTREFWSLELTVTADVLVPRPETEILVALALERLPAGAASSVLDLGTGSGAIALAIATERRQARLTGIDVSERALEVAAANAQKLGLPQIRWRVGSWLDAVPGERFHMIVANPPYIASTDPALAQLGAEPHLALTPGPMGLEALSSIAHRAAEHLHPDGWLLLEHGSGQAREVAGMLERGGFSGIGSYVDYSGKPRVTLGTVHLKR